MKNVWKVLIIGIFLINSILLDVHALTELPGPIANIYVDNTKIDFPEGMGKPFIDENNRVQIPFRRVLEFIGASVSWDNETETAIAKKDDIEVSVGIGDKYILRNTEVIIIDTKAVIIEDRTYIPVRAVLEAFGAKVDWEQDTKSVLIQIGVNLDIIKLPAYYDLRTTGKLTSVKDQKDIGACWAFATNGAIESQLLTEKYYDFSEDHLSLTHGYSVTQDEGGDFQISLAYLARWSGPVYEYEDPYGDGVSPEGLSSAVHIQEAVILPEKDYGAIKRGLMKYGGVQAAIHIKDTQNKTFGETYNDETASYFYQGMEVANHDVLIVGWDDDYPVENFINQPSNPGAFIVRNSYGTTFGEEGFFYISYEDVLIGKETIVYTKIESKNNYDKIYQSDWLGWVGGTGYGSDTAYFANIYTTSGKEMLEAVSFYATDVDTTYEVYVVQDFEDIDSFSEKTFITRGSLDYEGYYTIEFPEAIEVNGDYGVIVKVRTPGSLLPVAAEYGKDIDWLKDVDISDGRGYMSYDGDLWEDTEEIIQSNVCLKAFTTISQ